MKKPNRRDITIEEDKALSGVISIETLTLDAVKWMKENASEFGDLQPSGLANDWHLWVYKGYNFDEVISYLITKWDCDEYDNRR